MSLNHTQLLCFITTISLILLIAAPCEGSSGGKMVAHNLRKPHNGQLSREVIMKYSSGGKSLNTTEEEYYEQSDDRDNGVYYYDSDDDDGNNENESDEGEYYESDVNDSVGNGSGNSNNNGGSDGGGNNSGNNGGTGSGGESYTDKLKKYLTYRAKDGYESTPISWTFEQWAFMAGVLLLFGTAYTLCCMTLIVPCYCPWAVRSYARTFLR